MKAVFVDTSAIVALRDRDDTHHARAVAAFDRLGDRELITHTLVVSESLALIDRRLGRSAAVDVLSEILPAFLTRGVPDALFTAALAQFARGRFGRASLVDVASFLVMEQHGLEDAFAFDADFERAGYRLVA